MTSNWPCRERLASAIVGAIAAAFLACGVAASSTEYAAYYFWGVALSGFSLALSPHLLFERVSIEGFKVRGPVFYGGSAILALLASVCFVTALLVWASSRGD